MPRYYFNLLKLISEERLYDNAEFFFKNSSFYDSFYWFKQNYREIT